jgi:transposase
MLRQMERSTIQLLAKRGKSQRAIARELGYSRTTVARALGEPVDRRPAPRQRPSQTDAFHGRIRDWLQQGLTGVRMLELARSDPDQPYTGGRSVFTDAVRRIRRELDHAERDVPLRFEGLPGEYLQVDWGEIRHFPFTAQPPATRYFLACRLKYSRWVWVRFTADMRQETLFRGLADCLVALAFVPWVLVFDNMKTVTSGRDDANQPVWTPALRQFAAECGFHPEACAPAAGNQKGAVESLVKWVKGNFLAGREFADDADLDAQCTTWQAQANRRPSDATDAAPLQRLGAERDAGGVLPATLADYGLLLCGQVTRESFVHVLGNRYSVPVTHVGCAVTVRVHAECIVLWRDREQLATHRRAPDGAHQRVLEPAHFAPLFARKPRGQVMLYRTALLSLAPPIPAYVAELSRRRREHLSREVLALYGLLEQHGEAALAAAMTCAAAAGAYGAEYLTALLAPAAPAIARVAETLTVAGVPTQVEVDRLLSSYEAWVQVETTRESPVGMGVPA